jgi:N utilization substance protein A
VEIKSLAREAGYRSKIAVTTNQEGVDPVGCCVGLRGIRIQNIVNELNGEKIDIVMWNPDISVFITNALSPAKVQKVDLDDSNGIASVVVPDKQLSLAIGKEGQNARLAAKLTGWRIDIKSTSAAEAEAHAQAPTKTEENVTAEEITIEKPAIPEPSPEPTDGEVIKPVITGAEIKALEIEPKEETERELVEPKSASETTLIPPQAGIEPLVTIDKPEIRFAEDIMPSGPFKPGTKIKKKRKKATAGRKSPEEDIKPKKRRVKQELKLEDEEY